MACYQNKTKVEFVTSGKITIALSILTIVLSGSVQKVSISFGDSKNAEIKLVSNLCKFLYLNVYCHLKSIIRCLSTIFELVS